MFGSSWKVAVVCVTYSRAEGYTQNISQLFGLQSVGGLIATALHAELFEQDVKCSEVDLGYVRR